MNHSATVRLFAHRAAGLSRLAVVLMILICLLSGCVPSPASHVKHYWGGHPPSAAHFSALPQSTALTASGPAAVATELAQQLASANTASAELPLVLTALSEAGVAVNAGDGGSARSVANPPGIGVSMDPWEVQMLAGLEATHERFPLSDFYAAVSKASPALGADIQQGTLSGIKDAAASSPSPSAQMWGLLIIALGQAAPTPYDLSGQVDPNAVTFDGVQMALLLRSLTATLGAFVAAHHGASSATGTTLAPNETSAALLSPAAANENLAGSGGECTASENAQLAAGLGVSAGGGAWNWLTEFLDSEGAAALGGYSKILSVAGILAAYARLLATFALLHVDASLVNGPPLKRTTTTSPGEQRTIEATVTYTTKDSQLLNCIRWALASVGLDIGGVPQGGPLTEGAVQFNLLEGNQYVELKLRDGQTSTTAYTDENGMASIDIEGRPQKEPMPANAQVIMREAEVEMVVKAKGGNLKGDIGDLVGSAILILTDPTAILGVPADILMRTRIFAPTLLTIPVLDHGNDYLIDTTVPNMHGAPLHLNGLKCGGAGGEWDIDISGTTFGWNFDGSLMVVKLSPPTAEGANPVGNAGTQMHTATSDPVAGSAVGSANSLGTAHYNVQTGQLVVTLHPLSNTLYSHWSNGNVGTATGPVYSNGLFPTGQLSAANNGGFISLYGSGTISIPVQVGDFCAA